MAKVNKPISEIKGDAPEVITPEIPVETTQDVVKNEEQSDESEFTFIVPNDEAPEIKGDAPEVTDVVSDLQPPIEITEEDQAIVENGGPTSSISFDFETPGSLLSASKESMVKVLIKYPEEYKGDKFHKDGEVKHVGTDTAEIYLKKGIGKIVE